MSRYALALVLVAAIACSSPGASPRPDAGDTGAAPDAGSPDAGSPDAGRLTTLEIAPAQVAADGASAAVVTLHLRASDGSPAAARRAKILVSPASSVTPAPAGLTDANGDFQVRLVSTTAGPRAVVAWANGRATRGTVTFLPGPAARAQSSLEIVPPRAASDGRSLASVRAIVRDANGNAVPGVPVTLQAGGASTSVHGALSGVTDAEGVVAVNLSSAADEAAPVSASFAGFTVEGTAAFASDAVSSASSRLDGGSAPVAANGHASAPLTIEAVDARGLPATNRTTTIAAAGRDHAVLSAQKQTDTAGTARASLASAAAGRSTVVATVGGVPLSTSVEFVGLPWQVESEGLTGGDLLSFLPQRDGTLFATTTTGIYRSLDHGDTFVRLQGDNHLSAPRLAPDPTDPATMYALTTDALLKTINGGITWDPIGIGFTPESNGTIWLQSLAVDPRDPQTLYANGFYRAFKSRDGGQHWSLIASYADLPCTFMTSLAIDPFNSDIVYLGTDSGGFRSLDRGGTWSALAGVPARRIVVAPDPRAAGRVFATAIDDLQIFLSTDSGARWGAFTTVGRAGMGGVAYGMNFATDAGHLLVPTTLGLFRTGLDGSSTLLHEGPINAAAADPSDATRIFAASFHQGYGLSFLRSEDDGASWSTAQQGIAELRVDSIVVDPVHPATLYSDAFGLSKSTNGGATWVRAAVGLPAGYNSDQLAIDPADPSILLNATAGAFVYRSTDGAATWKFSLGAQAWLTFPPATPHLVYAGAIGALYASPDSGATWSPMTAPSATGWMQILAPAAAPQTLYCISEDINDGSHPQQLFRSGDGGSTWTPLARLPQGNLIAEARDGRVLYFLGNNEGAFLRSVDGGASFIPIATPWPPGEGFLVREDPQGVLWAAVASTLWRSEDKGATWGRADLGLFGAMVWSLAFHPTAAGVIWAGTYNSGLFSTSSGGLLPPGTIAN